MDEFPKYYLHDLWKQTRFIIVNGNYKVIAIDNKGKKHCWWRNESKEGIIQMLSYCKKISKYETALL